MAFSFNGVDLTEIVEVLSEDDALPFWELTNDPILRRPLAYGGESVQDSYVRVSGLTLQLDFPSYATFLTLWNKQATTGTMVYDGLTYLNVTLNQITGVRRYLYGSMRCTARFTRKGL